MGVGALAWLAALADLVPFAMCMAVGGVACCGIAYAHRRSGEPAPALVRGSPTAQSFQVSMALLGIGGLALALLSLSH